MIAAQVLWLRLGKEALKEGLGGAGREARRRRTSRPKQPSSPSSLQSHLWARLEIIYAHPSPPRTPGGPSENDITHPSSTSRNVHRCRPPPLPPRQCFRFPSKAPSLLRRQRSPEVTEEGGQGKVDYWSEGATKGGGGRCGSELASSGMNTDDEQPKALENCKRPHASWNARVEGGCKLGVS